MGKTTVFCSRLLSAIAAKKLNQSQIAEKLGWPRQRINQYCSGRRYPNSLNARRLAIALEVPLDWLLGGDAVPAGKKL